MRRWQDRRMWKTGTILALAAVVSLASPAAAAVDSTTTVTASPPAANVGVSVTLTATVTCADDPTGGLGVTFFDGGDLLDTVPVSTNGQAEHTTSFTTTGTHTITAAYNGNDNCFASSNTTTVVVSAVPVPVPPTPPANGFCLLACGGLIGFTVGDINNNIEVH
ncbi:Ig-like domain-containing protein [Streptomyces sp. NRRL WC-3618]|uniref:Ig-like domain-containing protein n=1 Tax=Streptomyces sp. NRRL WC-3618 TaxID=1519490 RepID=UPI001F28AB41|nr:Ig-like domain-containing protein [Streptomyces sp. NRRL WC-3618]